MRQKMTRESALRLSDFLASIADAIHEQIETNDDQETVKALREKWAFAQCFGDMFLVAACDEKSKSIGIID